MQNPRYVHKYLDRWKNNGFLNRYVALIATYQEQSTKSFFFLKAPSRGQLFLNFEVLYSLLFTTNFLKWLSFQNFISTIFTISVFQKWNDSRIFFVISKVHMTNRVASYICTRMYHFWWRLINLIEPSGYLAKCRVLGSSLQHTTPARVFVFPCDFAWTRAGSRMNFSNPMPL